MQDAILHGDCLDLMQEIPAKSVDAVVTDPPYAITVAKWDLELDWTAWWREIKRVRKPNAPILMFCVGRFCGQLYGTNPREWRYDLVWIKDEGLGFLNAKRAPLRRNEKIFVFYKDQPTYNPQFQLKNEPYKHSRCGINTELYRKIHGSVTGEEPKSTSKSTGPRYPSDVIYFQKANAGNKHPTAKPVGLCEYLIKTYTNAGDIVLDPFCGGGAVPVAAVRSERHYIGIERDDEWFEFARNRVESEKKQTKLSWW